MGPKRVKKSTKIGNFLLFSDPALVIAGGIGHSFFNFSAKKRHQMASHFLQFLMAGKFFPLVRHNRVKFGADPEKQFWISKRILTDGFQKKFL